MIIGLKFFIIGLKILLSINITQPKFVLYLCALPSTFWRIKDNIPSHPIPLLRKSSYSWAYRCES
jgi:hypothetical protein